MAPHARGGAVAYRIAQGWRALMARPVAVDPAALRRLPPRARAAFLDQPPALQRHALAVHERLWHSGCRDEELLAAALLHDIGKVDGRRAVGLWQRTLAVLLGRWPALLAWLGRAPGGWRHGFYLQAHHPALGSARVAVLGLSPRVAALIAAHQSGALDDPGLAALRAADAAD